MGERGNMLSGFPSSIGAWETGTTSLDLRCHFWSCTGKPCQSYRRSADICMYRAGGFAWTFLSCSHLPIHEMHLQTHRVDNVWQGAFSVLWHCFRPLSANFPTPVNRHFCREFFGLKQFFKRSSLHVVQCRDALRDRIPTIIDDAE